MIHLIKYMHQELDSETSSALHLYQDCDGLLKRLINCIKIVTYINYKNISERGCYLFSWEATSRIFPTKT